jgi:hypothetical protein
MALGRKLQNAVEVTIVCVVAMTALAASFAVYSAVASQACYHSQKEDQAVRWTLTGGCEVREADTWVNVPSGL